MQWQSFLKCYIFGNYISIPGSQIVTESLIECFVIQFQNLIKTLMKKVLLLNPLTL